MNAADDPVASDRERTRLIERYRSGDTMKPSEAFVAKVAIRMKHAELRAREAV